MNARSVLVLACLQALWCACSTPAHSPDRPIVISASWEPLYESCSVSKDINDLGPDYVYCPRGIFMESLIDIRTLQQSAEILLEEVVQCQALADIDKRELESEKAQLKWKLDDPWRSPWLWGVIGLAAGTAVGIGLGIGFSK